jgi:hypothetical protein
VCTPVIKKGLQDDTETVYYLIGRILLSAKISLCKDDDLSLKTKWEKDVGSQGMDRQENYGYVGFDLYHVSHFIANRFRITFCEIA